MNKLEELIKKLCPNGVEYKKIEEFTSFEQPTKYIVKNTKYNGDYKIPVLTAGQTFILGYTNETDGIYDASEENPVIIFDDFTGAYKWVDFSFKVKSSAMKIITTNGDKLLIRFLYHMMGYLNFTSDEHKRLWISIYSQMRIAVPPLEVQCEIVHILDDFTLLSAELSAELKARRKQFNYYRDELIKTAHGAEYKTLKEIATDMYRGAGIKRDEVTETGIPCVRYGEIYTTYNVLFDSCVSHTDETKQKSKKYFEYGDVLFAITGESVEEIGKSTVYLGNNKCLAGGDTVVMKHNENPKYIGYALSTTEAQMQKSKGKVKSKVVHSSVPALKEISIPIPSLKEQERIASLIENFDKICNDLSEGLPAEIEKRQKQYDYYRDKLLSFKEVEENV